LSYLNFKAARWRAERPLNCARPNLNYCSPRFVKQHNELRAIHEAALGAYRGIELGLRPY
jgi:hypothetical protein